MDPTFPRGRLGTSSELADGASLTGARGDSFNCPVDFELGICFLIRFRLDFRFFILYRFYKIFSGVDSSSFALTLTGSLVKD